MGTLGMYDYAQRADVGSNAPREDEAPAPAQRVTFPPTFHPPAGARLLALVLAGACPGAPAAAANVAKLSALTDTFDPAGFDTRWLKDYARVSDSNNFVPDARGWAGWYWDGNFNDWGGSKGTATVYDATAALVTLDLVDFGAGGDYGGVHGEARLSVWYEDRAHNERLRMRIARPGDGSYRLDLMTERSEGVPTVLASRSLDAHATARAMRCGLNPDGTVRLEVLRTSTGAAEQWEGIAGQALTSDFLAGFNPAAVYVHIESQSTAAYPTGVKIGNLRGSRPVGPTNAVADLQAVASALAPLAGAPTPKGYRVPQGRSAVVDTVAVTLLVVDGGAADAAHPHAVADVWARLLVDGAPMEGLCELRPAAVLALGTAPAGTLFRTERRNLGLLLQSGQQLGAQLVARDSNAAHVVAVEVNGWTFTGGA